jgi:hypothetical protein
MPAAKRARMRRLSDAAKVLLGLLLLGCGGRDHEAEAPQKKVTAEAEVLGISSVWQALEEEHGTRGPKHKVAVFDLKQRTTLTLFQGQTAGEEKIELKEHFEMKNGAVFECRARGLAKVRVRFGRKNGTPALEVHRPSLIMTRTCQPSGFPETEIQMGGVGARFLLQDEQLVGFAPPGEKRVFLPKQ